MNSSRVRPRGDQIAELTRGMRLPLPPLHEKHLQLITEGIRRAWSDLLSDQYSTLLSGAEPEVNALMETRLNALTEEDEVWSLLVKGVARGKETVSYDGSHLEKRPDLSIYLTNRGPSFPLIVECKLIDASSKKGIDRYCGDGLIRFVQGDYGWGAREAFMLAYVRDGSTIASCLVPFLAQGQTKSPDIYITNVLPEPTGSDLHVARSSHGRGFRYTDASHDEPGPIDIWHVWITAMMQ